MLKEDLLPILQDEAKRLGLRALTDRAWQDWLDEKLIDSPAPRGRKRGLNPIWDYPNDTLERAQTILRLKSEGFDRFPLLRLQLSWRGYKIAEELLIGDLKQEFEKLLKREFFRQPWTYDANQGDAERSRERQLRKLPAVDARIAATKPSDEFMTDIGSQLSWGSGKIDVFDRMVFELARIKGVSPDHFAMLKPFKDHFDYLSGLFGNPDEMERSGLDELATIDLQDLLEGQTFYGRVLGLFDQLALVPQFIPDTNGKAFDAKIVAQSLRMADWSVLIVSVGALVNARRRANGS